MNNSTVSFSTPETSANSIGPMDIVEVCMLWISFLVGVPSNIYIIWLIVTGPGSGVASEFFNLNLSVCEIGICLNNLLTILPIFFSSLSFLPLFLQGLNMTSRPLFQSLICVERYLAVVHPVTFLKYKPLRYRVICCSVAWIITLGSCFYSLFIIVTQKVFVRVWSLSTFYLIFLSIQLFCLVAVLRALKQSGPGERKRDKEEENHMKRRAFKVILITTVSLTFIYVPSITTGYSVLVTQHNIHVYWVPCMVFYVLAGFVQPVLFLHRAGKISCSVMKTCSCDNLLSECCIRLLY